MIPARHSYGRGNLSPPLAWSVVPVETRSFALLCEDPDAPGGTFVHWMLYNLVPDSCALAEGVPPTSTLPSGARQGRNDGGSCGYMGPDPPPGAPHRYRFTIAALDTMLTLPDDATGDQLRAAIDGRVLASGTLVGAYQQ